jgi:anti-anti-sigma factor
MHVHCEADREAHGAVVATLSGNLDAQGATHFWEVAVAHLADGSPSLMVDMSGVELMTSAGVGTLIRLLHRVQSLGGGMVVFGCSDKVRQVIEVVMLAEIFRVSDSIEQARERL